MGYEVSGAIERLRRAPDVQQDDYFDGLRRHRHAVPALRRLASTEDLDASLG